MELMQHMSNALTHVCFKAAHHKISYKFTIRILYVKLKKVVSVKYDWNYYNELPNFYSVTVMAPIYMHILNISTQGDIAC